MAVCLFFNSCSLLEKEKEAPPITLTSENTKQYLQMEVKYSNVEIEEVQEIIDDVVWYYYVCTATYTVKSRGPYMFKDARVYLVIRHHSSENPWSTALSNVSAADKLSDVRRRETIYLDSSGNGSIDVIWKYSSGLTTAAPSIKKPENQTWNIEFYASGELKEIKWSD